MLSDIISVPLVTSETNASAESKDTGQRPWKRKLVQVYEPKVNLVKWLHQLKPWLHCLCVFVCVCRVNNGQEISSWWHSSISRGILNHFKDIKTSLTATEDLNNHNNNNINSNIQRIIFGDAVTTKALNFSMAWCSDILAYRATCQSWSPAASQSGWFVIHLSPPVTLPALSAFTWCLCRGFHTELRCCCSSS